MPRQLTSPLIVLLIVVSSAFLYGRRLDYAPPHVEIDEVLIALDAHAIASTGRDLRGERLPLYSQTAEHSWYQPFVIYVTAVVLKILPLTERIIRLPTVGLGILNIVLIYFVARQLFESQVFGVIAAALLALTPAHFIHSRYGMDYIYPLPFVLGWLLCLVSYDRRRQPWLLVVGTVVLGVGFYSYIASIVLMPLYFLLTCLFLLRQQAPRRLYWLAAAGFFPMLVPFVVWIARHPAAYAATIVKYGLYDANQLNAVQGLRSFFSYMSISQRVSQYWNFFNPAFLFFGGGALLMFSTNLVGVFALPLLVLLPAGVYFALKHSAAPIHLIICVGFATAPLPALIVAEQAAIFRALPILPFGVLLATLGLYWLWSRSIIKPFSPVYRPIAVILLAAGLGYTAWTMLVQSRSTQSSLPLALVGLGALGVSWVRDRTRQWRIVAVCLLALAPIQFSRFWSDYFSDYRVRSAHWLGGNIAGALEDIIDRDQHQRVPAVYFATLRATSGQIDSRDQYMDAYWKFYLIKHGRPDLLARTMSLETANPEQLQAGSLVLANSGDVKTETLVQRGVLKHVKSIPELNGTSFFVILQR